MRTTIEFETAVGKQRRTLESESPEVRLSLGGIVRIELDQFEQSSQLEFLDLSNNAIEQIDLGPLARQDSLRRL